MDLKTKFIPASALLPDDSLWFEGKFWAVVQVADGIDRMTVYLLGRDQPVSYLAEQSVEVIDLGW